MTDRGTVRPPLRRTHVLAGFALVTALAFALADLRLLAPDPAAMLAQMARGLLHPDFGQALPLLHAAALTLAFALVGVTCGALAGLVMAPAYRHPAVRGLCVALRSIHELFWALLLMQVTGLSPLTGVLAIALPYAGIFAKVFAEYLEEVDAGAASALPRGTGTLSALLWTRLPLAMPQMLSYAAYRMECGLRSSAVLGFVGLPTLGFLMESYFRQADYAEAAAVLLCFFAIILPLRLWLRWRLVPLYLLGALVLLAQVDVPPMGSGILMRFAQDIVPAPLRQGDLAALPAWLWEMIAGQIAPGTLVTLVLSQLALALAALIAGLGFPLMVRRVTGRVGAVLGDALLAVLRNIPDYMLAFILLQCLGPSMLPAVLALGLHNGAIIAHLLGRQAQGLALRPDAPRGLTLWGWELLPRQFPAFLALLLYRWEIIVRDSAIFGLIGVATLGFHVDAAIQQLRLDRAVLLLVAMGLLTLAIDLVSSHLRGRMRLAAGPVTSRVDPGRAMD
ncbi:PhnE/PtxC family ABC transporter permease [Pseudoroseicyclus aestuarii]|uniref:Phosphonate transport system permease protein n=1 Tax=Pseudoroseicyclus aestuarii TaxID=1795041 RepID=A0A318SVS9_9RHOB|nr:ABC transporter permease [Pseudoroseicyclus aestuarii]PYE84479.1 phosphonate transport system permease protein [Pseudoroseicyclus aestuarii]